MAFSASIVIQFMTGYRPLDALTGLWSHKEPIHVQTDECSSKAALPNLSSTSYSSIKKLAVYQQACHSMATDTLMLFLSMPKNQDEARKYAIEDAKILKAYASVHVRPLIMIEPTDKEGGLLDFQAFANGSYNSVTDAYFTQLKADGITDSQLGIINPFPEANLPYWKNNKPEFFSPSVTNYLTIARKYFPQVATSVLLNSATYEMTDFNWENGDYNSLLPYVKDIPVGLVNYAGIQGFPWIARQGGTGTIFNADEFLNSSILEEMAEKLQTKKVWFNTGTFSAKYTLDAAQMRTISASQRKEILMTIKGQATVLQKDGYDVAVNLFAEDKSEASEETNWSYWKGSDPFTSQDTPVITSFIKDMNGMGVHFWLFDK